MIKELKMVDPLVINHLNINNYETQTVNEGTGLYDKHPNLLFKMYETLINLDKNILQELFTYTSTTFKDEIGVKDVKEKSVIDNFRFDFFLKAIKIMDDLITSLLQVIEDRTLAVFIE